MIISVRVNNYRAYANPAELSLKADMRIKKFPTNVNSVENCNIVKASCLYGGNNVGKTCMVYAINTIVGILLNRPSDVSVNLFSDNPVCALGITFDYKGSIYSYDFKFDNSVVSGNRRAFTYEKFSRIVIDKYGNSSEKVLFLRDIDRNVYEFNEHPELVTIMGVVSSSNILIYILNGEMYPKLQEYKNVLTGFASMVDVIDMNNIPVEKTIRLLKENNKLKERVVEFIRKADVEIDNFLYATDINPVVEVSEDSNYLPQEVALRKTQLEDMLRLCSVHKGKMVQSLLFDSTGTKKIAAIASFVADAVTNGRILVVDELDSSLHFKLTRAIVSLFNNSVNESGQLICTVHDITMLDCRRLFRKDQIWFANKDENGATLTSLTDYTSLKDSVRSDTDIMNRYELGLFGNLPDPDFVSVMLEDQDDEM